MFWKNGGAKMERQFSTHQQNKQRYEVNFLQGMILPEDSSRFYARNVVPKQGLANLVK